MKNKLKYTYNQIYRNCVFAMCVHISTIPRLQCVSFERSWDGISYSFQEYGNTEGTISFDVNNGVLVGAFRNNVSERMEEYPKKNAMELFNDADESICKIAREETLNYLLLSFEQKKSFWGAKKQENVVPVATTAFWSEGDYIYSLDDEESFVENGGRYIKDICVPKDELVEALTDYYELTSAEMKFAERLFELKCSGDCVIKKEMFSNIVDEESDEYEEFLQALSDFDVEVI